MAAWMRLVSPARSWRFEKVEKWKNFKNGKIKKKMEKGKRKKLKKTNFWNKIIWNRWGWCLQHDHGDLKKKSFGSLKNWKLENWKTEIIENFENFEKIWKKNYLNKLKNGILINGIFLWKN
jgi:hypothetical protein